MEIWFDTWQFNLGAFWISIVAFFHFYKLAVKHARHDGAATVLLQLIAGTSVLVFVPFYVVSFPADWIVYLYMLIACLFYAVLDRLQTTARKHLPVSTYTIISQLNAVFLIAFGVVFLKEAVVPTKMIGATLIILGNVVLLFNRNALQWNKYIFTALGAAFAFAAAMTIDIGISEQFNLPLYISITLLVPALLVRTLGHIGTSHLLQEWNSKARPYYVITGLIWGLVILFSLRTFQLGDVMTIVPLQALSVPITVLCAYAFLHERNAPFRKVAASFLVVLGVYVTVLG